MRVRALERIVTVTTALDFGLRVAASERLKRDVTRCLLAGLLAIGCTTLLGVDGDYSSRDGSVGTSGVGATGGHAGDAPSEAAACPTGQKSCSGGCVLPQPQFGCGAQGCTACGPAPPGAVNVCRDGQCAFDCTSGYDLVDGGCQPNGSGGSGGVGGSGGSGGGGGSAGLGGSGGSGGGTGGTGGTGGASGSDGGVVNCIGGDASVCPQSQCVPLITSSCCRTDGTCSCAFPAAPCL